MGNAINYGRVVLFHDEGQHTELEVRPETLQIEPVCGIFLRGKQYVVIGQGYRGIRDRENNYVPIRELTAIPREGYDPVRDRIGDIKKCKFVLFTSIDDFVTDSKGHLS